MNNVRFTRGFTLLETLIALTVLAVGSVGALAAIGSAQKQVKDGQTRQYREVLLDATSQRWEVASKIVGAPIFTTAAVPASLAVACPTACNLIALGAGNWIPDPTSPTTDPVTNFPDLATGAYYMLNANGSLTQLTATSVPPVPAGTPCGSAALPPNSYCREVMITTGAPIVSSGATWTAWPPPAAQMMGSLNGYVPNVNTLWVRVSKQGDLLSQAVFLSMTVVQ